MRCTTEHDGEIKATCLYLNRGASTKPGAIQYAAEHLIQINRPRLGLLAHALQQWLDFVKRLSADVTRVALSNAQVYDMQLIVNSLLDRGTLALCLISSVDA